MNRSSGKNTRRRGFALVSTVMLIGIAGLLLVNFSRLSVNKSLQVIRETAELQKNWSAASSQRLVVGGIRELLAEETRDPESGQTRIRAIAQILETIDLRDVRLELLVADESAKLDLNFVASLRGAEGLRKAVRELDRQAAMRLHLLPKQRRRDARDHDYVSWDQVFENPDGTALHPDQLIPLTRQMTCWGKRICLGSSSDETLEKVCELTVGSGLAPSVLDLRRQEANLPVREFLTRLALPAEPSGRLAKVLTDHSVSQSIWLKATHRRSGSRSCWLVIREGFIVDRGSRTDTFRYQVFQW